MNRDVSGGVVLAIDQGTGSTKGLAISASGEILARSAVPLAQEHPRPGWVEQDARAIADSVLSVLKRLRESVDAPIAAIGLSTQRESALAWDEETGEALSPVIGWQDRRTAARADALAPDAGQLVRWRSGLPLDPMFSALKFEWLLDRIDPDRTRARAGRITLGTVDAWLVRTLTGERRIEVGNASRTQLLDTRSGEWSDDLLGIFGIPRAALPDLSDSDSPSGAVTALDVGGASIAAVLGDSHAALFGHGIREPGRVKVTYGTGSSVMGLDDGSRDGRSGDGVQDGRSGVVRTIAWAIQGRIRPAFEGNILSTGGTLDWLARLLGIEPSEVAALAQAAGPSELDVVPAFAGLGAPWWDERAVGLISGVTLGTGRAELARAVLDSVVLQVEDVLEAAEREIGTPIDVVNVDGAPSANDWLMQLQADLSGRRLRRPEIANLSALGAAWLAGQSVGVFAEAAPPWRQSVSGFEPAMSAEARLQRSRRWHHAVRRARLREDADRLRAVPPGHEIPTKEIRA